jgi:processing peptidase subunit beta
MDYNNENAYYRINCHSHDVTDVFSMLVDCALEPKNVVACAVGRLKNTEAHQVDAESGGNYKFNDHIYTAAYGGKTLGNPTYGRKSNIANLSAEIIQKFQMTNMTNDRIVISATGIENHK